ncbi:S41 family peptidase [Fulvivirga maritima]|uniref:S41 family peptidase n=1 Tax=Fulvivirga maritima TaxID=2904247 RepID=UPI001F16A455|nr:S41 family peptidase [Fulvivirga maritima]UII28419.1 S41 family peptidase [Fulvivirga maritima]
MRYFISFLLISVFSGVYAQKLSRDKQIEDFDYLVNELRLRHQGLYEYQSKDKVDYALDSIRAALTRQSTLDFYKTLRYTIGLTNEGHTSIDLPKWTMIKLGLSKSFLPLSVKFLGNELVVNQNYGKDKVGVKKGDRIISVNGKSITEITNHIFPLIPTDGFNTTSQYAWSGGINFSLLYRLVYGKTKRYVLELEEYGTGKQKNVTIPAVRFTSFKSKKAKLPYSHFDYQDFMFEQINDSIAYLSIPGFGEDDFDYETYYKEQFKKIDSLKISHLIIGIQYNGGGTEGNENLLYSYLDNKRIRKYAKVTMLPAPYERNKEDEDYIFDKWQLKGAIAERGDFTLYSDYYSDLEYEKPMDNLVYTGKVYVLISGKTFSGGAEFASLVKMSDRGIFIGEEVGGAYEGNVSGYAEYVELPNSKIEVKVPTVHFQINVDPKVKGHGVMPDHEAHLTWDDYMHGNNSLKDYTVQLILEGE